MWSGVLWWGGRAEGREGKGGGKTFSKRRNRNLESSFLNDKRDLVNRASGGPKILETREIRKNEKLSNRKKNGIEWTEKRDLLILELGMMTKWQASQTRN